MNPESLVCADADTRVLSFYDANGLGAAGTLDDLTRFAAALCEAPVALVTLLEEEHSTSWAAPGSMARGRGATSRSALMR